MNKIKSFFKENWRVVLLVLVLLIGGGYFKVVYKSENRTQIISEEKLSGDFFEYKGREGIDALTLLKEKTKVEQDKTGMVVSINERKAENEKREFWSFYVNGVQATVGSADYKTKDNDIISWKIENY